MFHSIHSIAQAIQPLLVPICFATAWLFVLSMVWSFWRLMRETVVQATRMHQIPCTHCQFFSDSHHLKCTLHPAIAQTEAAIHCPDYQAIDSYVSKGA